MKTAATFFLVGVLGCGSAILYFYKLGGSQPVFVTLYIAGTLLSAFGAAGIVFRLICQKFARLKMLSAFLAVIAFAATVVGLFSPFYMLK